MSVRLKSRLLLLLTMHILSNYPNSVYRIQLEILKNLKITYSAKIPLTSGAGHQYLPESFLWVVLWVRGVVKTHILLIKFGKI